MRSSRGLGTLRQNCVRKCLGSRLYSVRNSLDSTFPNVTRKAARDAGQLVGLQLLIPRILGAAAHMAHRGYLGYFIGLSALKPSKRWPIFGVGYFSPWALYALSKASLDEGRTFGGVGGSFVLCVFGSRDSETQPELCL